jgi:beta-galactosidase
MFDLPALLIRAGRLRALLLAPLLLLQSHCQSQPSGGDPAHHGSSAALVAPVLQADEGPGSPREAAAPRASQPPAEGSPAAGMAGEGLSYSADTIYFDGQPLYLWSGELPYYRISPQLWGERLDAARAAGVRFITAYVPWNLHEPSEGRFDFTGGSGDGRRDLVGFIELIAERGMYFIPKPGPFICAEVRHGGIPDWLTEGHPEICMRDQRGRTVRFRQDGTPLPDPLNPTYVQYVKRWYTRLYEEVLSKYQYGRGPIVALQVENELMYSTTQLADPFSWGYSTAVQSLYRDWLKQTYGDIAGYNALHATAYSAFSLVMPPRSRDWHFDRAAQWLAFQDWVGFKEWYGAAVLREYAGILSSLGVSVPMYHNAGMLEDQAPAVFGPLSQQMWLGVNFWLAPHPLDSYASYVQGVRRLKQLKGSQPNRPSIAPELNWGWGSAEEFDFLTRYTLPYSKGSNIYVLADSSQAGTLNGRPYSTSLQPYPGDAPIDSRGSLRPAYWSMARLIRYTLSEGADFAEATPISSITLGCYSPYNAPGLYTELGGVRAAELAGVLGPAVGANQFLQDLMEGLIGRDAEYRIVDLQQATAEELDRSGLLVVLGQRIMDAATQALLVGYVRRGGTLVLLPTIPALDLQLRPAAVLKQALLPELSFGERSLGGRSESLQVEGYGAELPGRLLVHTVQGAEQGYRVLARTGSGEPVAVEKSEGRGKLIYLGSYVTDADFYLWLAQREGYIGRFAWSDDPQVEVVPLRNPRTGDSYLFVVNRSRSERAVRVSYLQSAASGGAESPIVLSISVAGGTVSILAVARGELLSASLNGGGGVEIVATGSASGVASGVSGGAPDGVASGVSDGGSADSTAGSAVHFEGGSEADLLRERNGELLFRSDRATQVLLRLPGLEEQGPVSVVSGDGEPVAATVSEGTLRFAYTPADGTLEYYRIAPGRSVQEVSLSAAPLVK